MHMHVSENSQHLDLLFLPQCNPNTLLIMSIEY